jgi:hypothetical protein
MVCFLFFFSYRNNFFGFVELFIFFLIKKTQFLSILLHAQSRNISLDFIFCLSTGILILFDSHRFHFFYVYLRRDNVKIIVGDSLLKILFDIAGFLDRCWLSGNIESVC